MFKLDVLISWLSIMAEGYRPLYGRSFQKESDDFSVAIKVQMKNWYYRRSMVNLGHAPNSRSVEKGYQGIGDSSARYTRLIRSDGKW